MATMNVASSKVPYYTELFRKAGVKVADGISLAELTKLPVLTKDIIRQHFQELLNVDIKGMDVVRHRSSGTTGQALVFYLPRNLLYSINYALLYRFYSWFGIRRGDKRVTLGGRLFTKKPPYYAYNMAENQLLLSIHHLNDETAVEYIDRVKKFAPVMVQGHPSGLHFLARRMLDRGVKIPVRAVFTTGETLFGEQRATIQEAFSAGVYQAYGLGEAVVAAFECERQDGFHEASEFGIIDFEHCSNGDTLVSGTSLWNDAMPFIRYRIEDIVVPCANYRCACGRASPKKIQQVIGRVDDILTAADGCCILPVTIRMLVKPLLQPFETYQVRQIGQRDFSFSVTGNINDERATTIQRVLRTRLGEAARIEVRQVEKLLTSGGKMRNVINSFRARSEAGRQS